MPFPKDARRDIVGARGFFSGEKERLCGFEVEGFDGEVVWSRVHGRMEVSGLMLTRWSDGM